MFDWLGPILVKILAAVGGVGTVITLILTLVKPETCFAYGEKVGVFLDGFLKTNLGSGPGNKLGDKTLIPFARGVISGMGKD